MELSEEMLEELKCIQCDKYLTCGPIYIRNRSGEAICGRCTAYEDEPITRNKQYETVARKIEFPCANLENGCHDKIHFSESKYSNHEQNCKYRDRICPVSKSGECDWIGPWTTQILVDHCLEEHPNNVLNNPCTLQHDITKDSLNVFVVCAFNLLFILHVKVCVKSAKIYHSLRYLGNPKKASTFKYKVDVRRGEVMLSKPGKVAPEELLVIKNDSALALCVNSLLGFLGDYEGTTFTITVQRTTNTPAVAVAVPNVVTPKNTCLKCTKETKTPNSICAECQDQQQVKCARNYIGCYYKENERKCVIHERYYCLYRSSCFFCNKQTEIGKIQQHYLDDHADVTHQIGSTFRISQGTKPMLHEYCFLTGTILGAEKLICWYILNDSHFQIDIMSSLPSKQLSKYRCMVHITNPKSKHAKTFHLTPSKLSSSDWSIRIVRSNVPSNSRRFDIVVLFTEA